MDKSIRNLIQKATQDARNLLESEFAEQLEGTFDILLDGHIATSPGEHLIAEQRIIRQKILAAIDHEKAGGVSDAEAVASYLREVSFTYLNRFVALKMLEARGLVQECVSKGEQSSGFKEFCGLAPGLAELPDKGYRIYVESLFDELSTEIRVLFNRQDMASLLWPRRKVLEQLFAVLNRGEIVGSWREDETIGWVYQYFNSDEDRKKARYDEKGKSKAPQNSYELAVRNQFFTPRYVVEFLTDNTLGRIWYEMRKGDTSLKDACRYLVRRPNEVFLAPGEKAPAELENETDLSREELLKKPVYIEHRPKKDPRDLRVLDPACGSGHFLLYAFDLLERIYEEAWEDPESPKFEVTGRTLGEEFENLEVLRWAIPKLIIEDNLHGIDIDPRAVQIAALALWLRAQKAWKDLGLKAADRPRIARSNIVTAEPMPGEEGMRREFTAALKPRVLGQMVDIVFDKMKLAGEAGSLLKIEEEIKDAVAEARKQWLEGPKMEQAVLFPEMVKQKPEQQQLRFDLTGVTDEKFWEQAEDRILDALKYYAERAENGHAIRRRLFAEDAARGFAFIDICRKHYDVVLMNPPFGESSEAIAPYLERTYRYWTKNLLCAAISRFIDTRKASGFLGVIFDRTAAIKSSYEGFRRNILDKRIFTVADTGWNVLDANVETTVHVIQKKEQENLSTFLDVRDQLPDNKADQLLRMINELSESMVGTDTYLVNPATFLRLPNAIVGYYFDELLLRLFHQFDNLSESGYQARKGHDFVSENHFRLFWEIIPEYRSIGERLYFNLYNGGKFSLFSIPIRDVTLYGPDGLYVRSHPSTLLRNQNYQLKSGIGYGKRGDILDAHALCAEAFFTSEGLAITGLDENEALLCLSYLNSSLAQFIINQYCGQHKQVGYVNLLRGA